MLVALVFVLGYLQVFTNDILTSFLIQVVVMFAIPLLMYSTLFKKKTKDALIDCGVKKISSKMISISILLGVVLYFINSFVADAFAGIIYLFGYESISSSTISLKYSTLLKEFVLSCILPGICEEFLHRGIMLHANKKFNNTKFCLIISSILFGLMHLNIRQFFYATILGFLMGYVSLAADSIIPSMIIHFMNNFLSNYLFYGSYLNWPFAKFVNFVTNIFTNNIIIYIITSIIGVMLLLWLFQYLTKQLLKERAQKDIRAILQALQVDEMTLIQAQIKLNEVNKLLKKTNDDKNKKTSFNFSSNIFLISSLVLGTLITISSFIWGVI